MKTIRISVVEEAEDPVEEAEAAEVEEDKAGEVDAVDTNRITAVKTITAADRRLKVEAANQVLQMKRLPRTRKTQKLNQVDWKFNSGD